MNTNHVLATDVKNQTVDGVYVLTHSPKDFKDKDGPVYFRTELPGGYEIEGLQGKYLLGYVTQRKSNLNITTLNLVGPDGIVHSHDTLDVNDAIRTFSKMRAANVVDYADIGTVYVD